MIVDCSFRPPYKSFTDMAVFNLRPEETMAVKLGMTPPPSVTERSMDLLLKEMDEAEIVHGVAYGRARDGSRTEDLIDLMNEYPGRFTGFAGINLTNMRNAIEETNYCLDKLGLKGVMLEPAMRVPPIYPDDALLYPIYEICQQRGAHVSFTLSGQAGPDISYCHPVHLDHISADFPDLNFIVRHACWPWVTEALGVAFKRQNVYLIPDAYGVSLPGYLQWVEAANSGYLADFMLFGTGYPIVPLKPMVDAFRKLPYRNDEVREKVEYKNAARLLNLPA